MGPPHPGLAQVRCSCCKAWTNRPCAVRSCSVFMASPPQLLFLLLPERVAHLLFTAHIEGTHSDRAASVSKKDGLAAPFPPFPFSLLLSRGWPEVPFDCAHRTSTFRGCAFCEQEGHSGYPSYSPCAADLNIRAVHIPSLVGQQIPYGCHRVVYRPNVPGRDAFGHAGQLFWRCAAGVDESG